MEKFLLGLDDKKYKISKWNRIEMKKFLSFLTVPVEKSLKHFGSDTGWTLHKGGNNLKIHGGIVGGVEYLDRIKYGRNLSNPYNNYVNPFFLFEIMNDDGKRFFIEYYKSDVEKVCRHFVGVASRKNAEAKKALDDAQPVVEFILREYLSR